VDTTVAKSMTQSDPIVSSVVSGILNDGGDDSPLINQFNLETQLQQQQQQQQQQLKQQIPLISSLNLDNANILMLQQQLKLKQQQYQQQLSEENISAAIQSKQFSDLASLTQNSAVDPILLAAAAAAASNPNSLLLSKLSGSNPQMTLDNLHTLQQQLSSTQQQQQQNMDPKRGAVNVDHPDADKWFYLDPQNQIQGSFSSEQMAGWFAAGYFTLNLMIKRGCDEKFLPLGRFFVINRIMKYLKYFCD